MAVGFNETRHKGSGFKIDDLCRRPFELKNLVTITDRKGAGWWSVETTSYVRLDATVESRLYVWIWREHEDQSGVYIWLRAHPKHGGVVACSKCWVAYRWWHAVRGIEEADLVRATLVAIEDYARHDFELPKH